MHNYTPEFESLQQQYAKEYIIKPEYLYVGTYVSYIDHEFQFQKLRITSVGENTVTGVNEQGYSITLKYDNLWPATLDENILQKMGFKICKIMEVKSIDENNKTIEPAQTITCFSLKNDRFIYHVKLNKNKNQPAYVSVHYVSDNYQADKYRYIYFVQQLSAIMKLWNEAFDNGLFGGANFILMKYCDLT